MKDVQGVEATEAGCKFLNQSSGIYVFGDLDGIESTIPIHIAGRVQGYVPRTKQTNRCPTNGEKRIDIAPARRNDFMLISRKAI